MNERGALAGIRVVELTSYISGPYAGMLLADFGAEVIKVEQPGSGDPLRHWTTAGQSLWWKVYARNKRFITLNLKAPEGRDLLLRMLPQYDVLMESFVPGTLERLGLGWEVLRAVNPKLVLVRISGWGQTGPGAQRPGFGTLVEAASGFAAMNGEPDGAPIVPGFPLADMTSALYATNAIMFALYDRDVHGGQGQIVDVSLFESLFSLLGPLPAEYAALGRLRERMGSTSKNAGPRGCFATSDGRASAECVRARRAPGGCALCDERGSRPSCRCAQRGGRRGHRVADPRRKRAHHRGPCVDGRSRANHRRHRTGSPLGGASPDGQRAERRHGRADAQRRAAPVRDAR
jgi:crotonobetainyl-CoA:carnitine CoA-transferase CaiB-like acyl-CoA transferase